MSVLMLLLAGLVLFGLVLDVLGKGRIVFDVAVALALVVLLAGLV